MMRRLICMGILVPAFGILLAGHASAGFTGASASGPGGTVTNLGITTIFTTDDTVLFDANYTAAAPIEFFLTLDGAGNYFVGESQTPDVTNSTSSAFPSFYAYLVSAPAGSTFNEASWDGAAFSNGTTFTPPFPNTTTVTFSGPPGIVAGASTRLGVGFSISASGPQTVELVLTPTAVPEPSTFTLGLIGAIASLGYGARRIRRQG
jgi:PEP-CTERM motif